MRFRAEGLTSAGQSSGNDDRFYVSENLVIVADGSGTISTSGGLDAALAIDTITRSAGAGRSLSAAMEEADLIISRKGETESAWRGAQPCLAAAHISENRIRIAHAGNCRAYVSRSGTYSRLTEDHSIHRASALEGFDTKQYPHAEDIITSAIGFGTQFAFDLRTLEATPGSVLVLCTRGLWRSVNEKDMARVVAASQGSAATGLMDLATANPSVNATVVVASVE